LDGGPPDFPRRFLVSRGTLESDPRFRLFAYRTITLFGVSSHTLQLRLFTFCLSVTPKVLLPPVWPLARSLATTCAISFDFSSSAYLDVSVQRVPPVTLCIHATVCEHVLTGVSPFGYLWIITPICGSPQLFAAYRVLHRLLAPRHPPCALRSLTLLPSGNLILNYLSFVPLKS
jgi:hypothetical protein